MNKEDDPDASMKAMIDTCIAEENGRQSRNVEISKRKTLNHLLKNSRSKNYVGFHPFLQPSINVIWLRNFQIHHLIQNESMNLNLVDGFAITNKYCNIFSIIS